MTPQELRTSARPWRHLTLPTLILTAALPAYGETLSGHVVDPQDRPVPDATLEMNCPALETPSRSTSDIAGAFRLEASQVEGCTLRVSANGFDDHRRTLTDESDLTITLELPTIRSEIGSSSPRAMPRALSTSLCGHAVESPTVN